MYRREEALRCLSRRKPTARLSGIAIGGSSSTNHQSDTSSTTVMDFSLASLITRRWMSQQSIAARSRIPTAHHNRPHSSTSSIPIRSVKAKSHQFSSRDHNQKSRFVLGIRSRCRSESKASQNQEVSGLFSQLIFTVNYLVYYLQFNGTRAPETLQTLVERLRKFSTITFDSQLRSRGRTTRASTLSPLATSTVLIEPSAKSR
jgi:hypothetical protein